MALILRNAHRNGKERPESQSCCLIRSLAMRSPPETLAGFLLFERNSLPFTGCVAHLKIVVQFILMAPVSTLSPFKHAILSRARHALLPDHIQYAKAKDRL